MSNPNNDNQLKHWLNELRDFFTESDIKKLSETLLEVYLNSHYANCQKSRSNMYFFLKKVKNLPINQQK